VLSARALPFFSAYSAAFAASSMDGAAFELARLGAIAGDLFVARTVGAKCWHLFTGTSRSNMRVESVCKVQRGIAIALLICLLKGTARGYL
jgi:hypothetical protein